LHMFKHFDNLSQYGDVYVQIPNGLFKDLADSIKSKSKTNILQSSFAYSYLVALSLLYKYAHFVDFDNKTYIQNSDLKQVLGYDKTTKTIDKIIKKGGVLEEIGLIETAKDYPISVEYIEETVDGLSMREFITVSNMGNNANDTYFSTLKDIVKNKNYEIKLPLFLFDYKDDTGTLYNYSNTHRINLDEFMKFAFSDDLDNVDFMIYGFMKHKCYGLPNNSRSLGLNKITLELGIGRDSFYSHLEKLENKGFIESIRKGWRVSSKKDAEIEANEYIFKGIS
jgi:biotin operon repressor